MTPVALWLDEIPLLVLGPALLICMIGAGFAGHALRIQRKRGAKGQLSDGQEGYIVSAMLGLLALLMGFTFSLAIDRFDARRLLVLEQANAIGTAYLRTQLLGEPHRTRLSKLLVAYTDNIITLAKADRKDVPALITKDDALLTDIWAATAAGFDSIKQLDFSSEFVESINKVIDLDASRRAARQARVPRAVFVVLLIYLIVTAGALGFVLSETGSRRTAAFLSTLVIMSLLLIFDIDRPTSGNIMESQVPMEHLRASLEAHPSAYDRWRANPAEP